MKNIFIKYKYYFPGPFIHIYILVILVTLSNRLSAIPSRFFADSFLYNREVQLFVSLFLAISILHLVFKDVTEKKQLFLRFAIFAVIIVALSVYVSAIHGSRQIIERALFLIVEHNALDLLNIAGIILLHELVIREKARSRGVSTQLPLNADHGDSERITLSLFIVICAVIFMKYHTLLPSLFIQFIAAGYLFSTGVTRLLNKSGDYERKVLPVVFSTIAFFAIVLRIYAAPHVIAHTNSHAYNIIGDAIQFTGNIAINKYGAGYYSFFHPFLIIFGSTENTVFMINSLIGGISAALVLPIVYLLTGSRNSALFSSVIMAVLPVHIKYSGTESMFILVVFLQLLVLLSVLLYVKEKHSVFAFAAGYYLVFLIQTRPMQLFFIVVVVLLLWAAHKRKEKLFTQSTWIAVALFIVVASLSGLRIYKYYLLQTGSIRPGMYSQKLEYLILKIVGVKNAIYGIPGNAYLDSDYTPVLFIILFITGMVSLSLTNRRLFIFLVLSGFMFAFLYSPVGQHPLNSIRFQNSYQHFFVIISGCGAAWIIQLLHRKKGVALALTITLILAIPLSAYRYRNLIEYKASPQLENEFIREALKDIDDGCYIIQQDQYIEGTNVRTWLPYYYSNYYEKNHIWMEVTDFQSRREEMGENQCILFYRGITCFLYSAHDDIDDSGTERIQCRGMMALNNKKPVAAAIVPSLPDFSQVYKTDYMQIGFFPIEPTRSGKQPDI